MGRGLRWSSLQAAGASLPAKPRVNVRMGQGGAIVSCNKAEVLFNFQATLCKLPPYLCNYLFHPVRKWEIDFAWPQFKIGMEVQGGLWGKSKDDKSPGAHGHPTGIRRDIEKHNAYLDLGWRVWCFEPAQIKDGTAVQHMERVLGSTVSLLLTNE
jgi:hypothetical protein